jgi:RNA polymerase sigma-70 factor (ECF subfamily)
MMTERGSDDWFATTQWSLVLAAGKPGDEKGRAALAELCGAYWTPIYAYVRRRSRSAESAQDLTQTFFLGVLEKGSLAAATPSRGRFRSFLLTSAKNFLANERARDRAQKRGGDQLKLSFDWAGAESRLSLEPADELTPERRFERDWAMTLLERVLERLRSECGAAGKARQFEVLKGALSGASPSGGYEAAGSELNCTPEAARQAAHRLKSRYRAILREEVAQTVADPSDVEDEIRGLFETFSE